MNYCTVSLPSILTTLYTQFYQINILKGSLTSKLWALGTYEASSRFTIKWEIIFYLSVCRFYFLYYIIYIFYFIITKNNIRIGVLNMDWITLKLLFPPKSRFSLPFNLGSVIKAARACGLWLCRILMTNGNGVKGNI